MSPGVGVSERDATVRNFFGYQDPGKEKNRRKKKASKGGNGGKLSVTVSAGSPARGAYKTKSL